MPTDPLNYFLIFLGGFGVVWAFRLLTKRNKERHSEFEYAAFSSLWGIPIFLIFLYLERARPDLLQVVFNVPMIAAPVLFILGGCFGLLGGALFLLGMAVWKKLENRK